MKKLLRSRLSILAVMLGYSVLAADGAGAAANQASMPLNCTPSPGGMSLKEEAKCACAAALKSNSIEALENFLLKYEGVDSECAVLASTALTAFAGGGGGGGTLGDNGNPGYGR